MLNSIRCLLVLTPLLILHGQDDRYGRVLQDAVDRAHKNRLETRKIELEERRLYLSTLQGSRLNEAKAQEVAEWILKNLRDYPQGKRAKNFEQDARLLVEVLATLQNPN